MPQIISRRPENLNREATASKDSGELWRSFELITKLLFFFILNKKNFNRRAIQKSWLSLMILDNRLSKCSLTQTSNWFRFKKGMRPCESLNRTSLTYMAFSKTWLWLSTNRVKWLVGIFYFFFTFVYFFKCFFLSLQDSIEGNVVSAQMQVEDANTQLREAVKYQVIKLSFQFFNF